MNTGSNFVKILCYGDSNTWGCVPGSEERYPVNIRWTGVLQLKLGQGCEVVEEGLNGRTTVLDDPDPKRVGKNGKTYLLPCLESQNPIDILILMLGTNDAKVKFNRSAQQITEGLEELIKLIKDYAKNGKGNLPEIIIVSPPSVDASVQGTKERYKGAEVKINALAKEYRKLADKYICQFVDIAKYVKPSSIDGLHLSSESHAKMAEVLFNLIVKIPVN